MMNAKFSIHNVQVGKIAGKSPDKTHLSPVSALEAQRSRFSVLGSHKFPFTFKN